MRLIFFCDPSAVVFDGNHRTFGPEPRANFDGFLCSVASGVRQEIRNDLLKTEAIPSSKDTAFDLDTQEATGFAQERAKTIRDFFDEFPQVHLLGLKHERTGRNSRDVEHVVDEAREALDLPIGLLDHLFHSDRAVSELLAFLNGATFDHLSLEL